MAKIEVKLNPDVPPTGSDLAIVNAARRSFGTRSNWDYTCECGIKEVPEAQYNKWVGCGADERECHKRIKLRTLKDKDKRLIEFLARGMTADDFDDFLTHTSNAVESWSWHKDSSEELVDLLWQWRNTPTHDTPFNHGFISFEVKAPIFVRAQLVKHEYLIMSEFSRRYITDEVEFFEPDGWRGVAKNKKQGSSDEFVAVDMHEFEEDGYYYTYGDVLLKEYQRLLESGVCPEQARMVLPQSLMTSWTWSGTLGAFAKMCTLRIHPEAQKEAKVVADAVYTELKKVWPVGAKALVEGV